LEDREKGKKGHQIQLNSETLYFLTVSDSWFISWLLSKSGYCQMAGKILKYQPAEASKFAIFKLTTEKRYQVVQGLGTVQGKGV
jgi:hypothetical protein